MNIKKNSLMVKTFTYLITFSITILICLWLFQVEFLKLFYEQYQIKDIKNVASDIIKSNSISKLEKIAYENDICIELKIDDEIIDYNTLNRDCILKSKNSRVQKLKESIYSNNKPKITLTLKAFNSFNNLEIAFLKFFGFSNPPFPGPCPLLGVTLFSFSFLGIF